jgi:cytochrome c oxidase assembly factor CtaG
MSQQATQERQLDRTQAPEPPQTIPTWFFVFEGTLGSAYDLLKASPQAWIFLVVVGATNLVISLTVFRERVRTAKAMWKGRRTRWIALGLVALRVAVHGALGLAGMQVDSAAGHLVIAVLMGAATVWLLWFTQRTSLRALAPVPPMLHA